MKFSGILRYKQMVFAHAAKWYMQALANDISLNVDKSYRKMLRQMVIDGTCKN